MRNSKHAKLSVFGVGCTRKLDYNLLFPRPLKYDMTMTRPLGGKNVLCNFGSVDQKSLWSGGCLIWEGLHTFHIPTNKKLQVCTQYFFLSLVATSLLSRKVRGKGRFVKKSWNQEKSWEITGLKLFGFHSEWPSGLAYQTQVLVLAAECGFESRPWHLVSLSKTLNHNCFCEGRVGWLALYAL